VIMGRPDSIVHLTSHISIAESPRESDHVERSMWTCGLWIARKLIYTCIDGYLCFVSP
jgi:hypothetical protein